MTFCQSGLGQDAVSPEAPGDNSPCYLSGELAGYLEEHGMAYTRGKPYHPQTQEKIECWHRSKKSQILLNNYYVSSELEDNLQQFVSYYNHERYHHSLDNLTLAHVYYGRGEAILEQGEGIKLKTLAMRRRMHFDRQGRSRTKMR